MSKLKLVLVGLPLVIGAAAFAFIAPREHPVGVRLASVNTAAQGKEVTVEFTRRNPSFYFSSAPRLQLRRDGRWEPAVRFREVGPEGLARTGTERVLFMFPPRTDACRFLLDYRVGRNPYCKAYFFLSKHGIMQKFPKRSRTALKLIPRNAGIRHFETELALSS